MRVRALLVVGFSFALLAAPRSVLAQDASVVDPDAAITQPELVTAQLTELPADAGVATVAPDPSTQGVVPPPPVTDEVSPERLRRRAFTLARLGVLNRVLVSGLSGQLRGGRLRTGITNLVLGTGLFVFGFFAPSGTPDMRPWFWASGAVAIATGGLETIWTPQSELLPDRYQHLPMTNPRERSRRVRFGEQSLQIMADDAMRRRVVLGVTKVVTSLGLLLVMYRDPIFHGTSYHFSPFDAVVIGYTGLDLVMAAIDLFTGTPEQRLLTQYQQTVQMLREEQEAGVRSAFPVPNQ